MHRLKTVADAIGFCILTHQALFCCLIPKNFAMFGEPTKACMAGLGWVFFLPSEAEEFQIQNGSLHKNPFQSKKITVLHDFMVLLCIYLIGMLEKEPSPCSWALTAVNPVLRLKPSDCVWSAHKALWLGDGSLTQFHMTSFGVCLGLGLVSMTL